MNSNKLIAYYDSLKIITRKQIVEYPSKEVKQYLKSNIKSILFSRKIFNRDPFFWPNGLLAVALEWSYKASKDDKDLRTLEKYYDEWISKGLQINHLDHCLNGYSLIYLHQVTNNPKYKDNLDNLFLYLKNHKKTNDGNLPYRKERNNIVLVDSVGMVCPFLCRYGSIYKNSSAIELGIKLLTLFLENGFNEKIGLPYHGYDAQNKSKLGIVGWGRGVGWLLIGIVDSLEYIPESHPQYSYLTKCFRDLVKIILQYQLKDGSFSWDLIANEGHSDSSATSMIMYSIKRGIQLGYLNQDFISNVNTAIESLYSFTENGIVS